MLVRSKNLRFSQLQNIHPISLTFDVSRPSTLTFSRLSHLMNIALMLLTLEVSSMARSTLVSRSQPSNMDVISTTPAVLKYSKFTCLR